MHDADEQRARGPAQTVLGAAVAASRWVVTTASPQPAQPPSRDDGVDISFVVLGLVGAVEDRVRGALEVAERAASTVTPVVASLVPSFVRRAVDDTLHLLDVRGRATADAAAASSTRLANTVTSEVVREELVTQTIMQVVDEVLPQILDRLATEPEQIRALIGSQSLNMAEELTQAARVKAAEGDEIIERVLTRLHLRRTLSPNGAVVPEPDVGAAPAVLPATP